MERKPGWLGRDVWGHVWVEWLGWGWRESAIWWSCEEAESLVGWQEASSRIEDWASYLGTGAGADAAGGYIGSIQLRLIAGSEGLVGELGGGQIDVSVGSSEH